MYKCGLCGQVSEPGQPRLLHVIYRHVPRPYFSINEQTTRTEIEREIPVCRRHYKMLNNGSTLEELVRDQNNDKFVVTRHTTLLDESPEHGPIFAPVEF